MSRRTWSGYWGITAIVVTLAAVLALALPAARSQAPKADTAPAGNAQNGKKIFSSYGCYECHGLQGQGAAPTGPRIAAPVRPWSYFSHYVRQPAGQMPPYTAKVVSDADLADIYAFLQSLPQPPPVKSIPLLNN